MATLGCGRSPRWVHSCPFVVSVFILVGSPPMPESNNLLFRDEVHRIVGCSMEVLNTLGHGLLEKPYENSLTVEFGLQGMKPANGFR